MNQVIVAEAAQILLERPASAIQRLNNQHSSVSPLISLQRLLVAPDWNALPVVDQQNGGQLVGGCRASGK